MRPRCLVAYFIDIMLTRNKNYRVGSFFFNLIFILHKIHKLYFYVFFVVVIQKIRPKNQIELIYRTKE